MQRAHQRAARGRAASTVAPAQTVQAAARARARGAGAGSISDSDAGDAAEVARRLTAQPGSHTHLESLHSPASWQSRAVVQVPPPTGRSAAPQCGKVATIRKRDIMAPGTLAPGSASCYLRLAQLQVSRGPPPPSGSRHAAALRTAPPGTTQRAAGGSSDLLLRETREPARTCIHRNS